MDADSILAAVANLESTYEIALGGVESKLDDVTTLLRRILSVLENIERKR